MSNSLIGQSIVQKLNHIWKRVIYGFQRKAVSILTRFVGPHLVILNPTEHLNLANHSQDVFE